jgi:hypothetical protein
MPPVSVLAVVALAVVVLLIVTRVHGVTVLAPKRTDRLRGAAQRFCLDNCRLPDDVCPLSLGQLEADDCPLWRFVAAGLPTDTRLDRLEPVGPAASRRVAKRP